MEQTHVNRAGMEQACIHGFVGDSRKAALTKNRAELAVPNVVSSQLYTSFTNLAATLSVCALIYIYICVCVCVDTCTTFYDTL